MRDNALYFPYINTPNSSWFFKILLYWDRVSSIVPYEYIANPQRLEPHMRELVSAELVNQVFPAQYIENNQKFEEPFITYIQGRINHRQKVIHKRLASTIKTQPIHIEKLGNLGDQLVQLKVARASNYPWFDVDEWVADAFMAYLATVLGSTEEINAAPVTNRLQSFQILGGLRPVGVPRSSTPQRRRATREIIIDNLLPTPDGPVNIREIVDFKAKYGHLLPRLRNLVESRCIDIAQIEDDQTKDDRIGYLSQEFNNEISDIAEAMKSKWSKIIYKSLVPLLSGTAAVVAAATGDAEIRSATTNIAAGGTLFSAIQQAIIGNNLTPDLANRPLAYAAHVRAHFPHSR